ncbi:MAG: cob(I)yrinic acid a,c-diamide adenosyltransferase [Deltaproteobacteria bacterium]|nr:cob(I)yrinic acid a,c-diamide adenosyltransferase [Deltaproteobacteria bacterium]
MVRLNRIYTRTGDDGTTALVGGDRVPKDDPRVEAYGTVDELNAALGALHPHLAGRGDAFDDMLRRVIGVQQLLFDLGATLATPQEHRRTGAPAATAEDVRWLEADIDRMNEALPELQSFILPGGGAASARMHVARTVCRRAERKVLRLSRSEAVDPLALRFLNRLSDWLFVAGRWAAAEAGETEVLWVPGRRLGG